MTKLLPAFFLFFSVLIFAQSKITVLDATTKKPIANAAVYCEDDLIGKTDFSGNLSFTTKCKKIEILASNYEDAVVEVNKASEVLLQPSQEKSSNIDRIVIKDKSDARALRILDEFNKRQQQNSPKSLDNYTFKSYSKFSIDVDKDSIDIYNSFLMKRKDSLSSLDISKIKQKDSDKKDSLINEDFLSASQESQMFLWEKASEHKFSKKYGEKTNIIDNRMSGFKNPIYEALALNISNLDRVPRQLKPENRNLFIFYLSETIELDDRKTFVIRFKEITDKKKQNPRKYNGKIYIDAETYALKKYESKSKKQNQGNITSVWKPINNKWFLDYEDIKVKMGDQAFKTSKIDSTKAGEKPKYHKKSFGNYLIVKNKFFDFQIDNPQKASDFKGYAIEIKNADGQLLNQYRTDSLTARESATYTKIDSFVEKHDFEKKLNTLTNLMRGNLRYKMIDFDLTKFISYNKYEGLRLGAGVKLNERFNKTFSPDAYFGYGFKDNGWKYGLGVDMKLSEKRNSILRVDYLDDVFAAGRFSNQQWELMMKLNDINIDWHNANFYRNQKLGASYLYDISNSLSMKLSLHTEKQKAMFDYQYKNWDNNFRNTNTTLSFKYSPNDKNVMTPNGKLTIERGYPQIFVTYENGSKILGGDLAYNKLDALLIHQFRSKLGYTNIKLYGGISSGTAPIWKNYEIAGQSSADGNWYNNISTPTNLGFVTMPAGTFYTDKFLAFQVAQSLPFRFKTIGKRYSSISLEYKSAIGDFKNPENHHFNFQVMDHLYQEAGFMWNNFLGRSFGVGLSYRLGYYQTPHFKDNFGLQLRLSAF